jgi:predicted AAA+ superfamily ATPase
MDLAMVKQVMIDQGQRVKEILDSPKIIDRDVEKIEKYISFPNVIAIIGVRRCGKSTLAIRILNGNMFGYLNFDDERLSGLEAKDLNWVVEASTEILGKEPEFFILDEIQNVKGWELFATRLRNTKKVIVTGSNAGLMWGDLATHLTGRHIDIMLQPFSFKEYLSFKGLEADRVDLLTTEKRALIRKELESYMNEGGFPEAQGGNVWILAGIYQDILLKDVILRYDVRNREALNAIARYLISNYSREFSYTRLGKIHEISNLNMVSDYVRYLVDVHLIFFLIRYSPKLSVQARSPKKVYCIDNGLARSVGFNISENLGLIMENIVALELRRRINNTNPLIELYYWKGISGKEVDFVVRWGYTILELVQVCYKLDSDEIAEREISSLEEASKELGCDKLTLITWNDRKEIDIDGKIIRAMPLYEWLLSSNTIVTEPSPLWP